MSLVLFFLFVLASAVFSGLEMAYISRERVAHMTRFRGAVGVFYGMRPVEVIATVLIGNNIAIVGATAAATSFFLSFMGRAGAAGFASLVTTVIMLVFGELIPKAMARSSPGRFMAVFGRPVYLAWCGLRPVVSLMLRMVRVEVEPSLRPEVEGLVERMLHEKKISKREARTALSGLALSESTLSSVCSAGFIPLRRKDLHDSHTLRAALSERPGALPVVVSGSRFLELDLDTLFAGRREFTRPMVRMSPDDRVSDAVGHLKKGRKVAVVDPEGKLLGVVTPRSLLGAVVGRPKIPQSDEGSR